MNLEHSLAVPTVCDPMCLQDLRHACITFNNHVKIYLEKEEYLILPFQILKPDLKCSAILTLNGTVKIEVNIS